MRFRFSGAGGAAVITGILLIPLPGLAPSISGGGTVIVPAGTTQTEDLYASGGDVIIEGTIEGDLVVLAGSLRITGRVDGDVLGLVGGDAVIGGDVIGSVRVVARNLVSDGAIGDDLAGSAMFADLRGRVGRDVLMAALDGDVTGTIGRDLLGQYWTLKLNGTVGRNVDVAVQTLTVGASTSVEGELGYRSSAGARVSAGARIDGGLIHRTSRLPLSLKAILRLVSILSVLAFVVSGVVALWAARRTVPRATAAIRSRPLRTALIGLGALILAPLLAIPLALTLVGIPLALVLLLAFFLALFFGPIPAVTAVGERLLGNRGGLFGGFVLGAVVWRLGIYFIPYVGAFLYLGALIWGVGGWVVGAWEARNEGSAPRRAEPDFEGLLPPEAAPGETSSS